MFLLFAKSLDRYIFKANSAQSFADVGNINFLGKFYLYQGPAGKIYSVIEAIMNNQGDNTCQNQDQGKNKSDFPHSHKIDMGTRLDKLHDDRFLICSMCQIVCLQESDRGCSWTGSEQ